MTPRLVILLLLMTKLCHAAPPKLFTEKAFNSASLAEAANYFIKIGENSAVNELNAIATNDVQAAKLQFRANERIGWVCRILFESKDGKSLRPPRYGALRLPWNSMPDKNWPLYPVAFSGSTYFVLSEGYMLGGVAENSTDYMRYCQAGGTFRKTPVEINKKKKAVKDAVA
ncbi:MAG: hypothetical protein JF609_04045, partial [Verrucomicrobia bacterium]|nr:hypothetical protein [Verrucomicrobiota bacterium]